MPTTASDIDVCIVASPRRLWIVRLLVLALLDLFRLRPRPGASADTICPCFFLSSASLNLRDIQYGRPDVYLAYWIHQLIPVYDPRRLYARLLAANDWISSFLPNRRTAFELHERWTVPDGRLSRAVRSFFQRAWGGGYGDLIEQQAKQIQAGRVERTYGLMRDLPDPRVIISEAMLKFHVNDRRRQYYDAWIERSDRYSGTREATVNRPVSPALAHASRSGAGVECPC